jgi:uracil-DNA glycosylase
MAPTSTRIAIVGEAWGEAEERARRAFVGYTGQELWRMVAEAGFSRTQCCLVTNVFNFRPPGNKVEWFCGPKSSALPGYPPLLAGKYVRGEFRSELQRLSDELVRADPNVIVAVGNAAMWALLGKTAITKFRGITDVSTHTCTGFKVVPTFHPSYLVKGKWDQRPTVILDLKKALREAAFPELRRPRREIWIEPTLEDLEEFYERYIRECKSLSIDIETSGSLITCIGFSPSSGLAIVIPFIVSGRKVRSYWHSHAAERAAWVFVKRVLELPCSKLFQNGLYDIAFLWRSMGLKTFGAEHDTMLLHYALHP